MAGERRAVPAEEPDGLALGHAVGDDPAQAGEETAHPVGRLAGRPLEVRQLLDLVDDPQAVAGVDEQVAGVLDEAGRADRGPQLVDEERRHLEGRPRGVRLPAGDADADAAPDPLPRQDVRERRRAVAGLARQAEVLEEVTAHRQRRGAGHPPALVADQDRRVAGRADHDDRLLEAGVEAGEPGDVRAVLAVGVQRRGGRSRAASIRSRSRSRRRA